MRGEATPAQIGGFLVALRAKGETVDEIAGCAAAMREHVVPVRAARDDLVDTAGTGGDGAGTLNISTAAAHRRRGRRRRRGQARQPRRVVAPRARPTCSRRSASGSSSRPSASPRSIDQLGFGFMFAPLHHPAMRHAAPVRRELATRTVFNVLGPLTNPAGARAQVIGVYAPGLVRTIAEVARQLGADPRLRRPRRTAASTSSRRPARTSSARCATAACSERDDRPGASSASARCAAETCAAARRRTTPRAIRDVFAGADGGQRDAILLNAAGAIAAAGHAGDLRDGLGLAARTRSTRAARSAPGSTSSRAVHAGGRMLGRFSDALAGPGLGGDRRGQAPLAVGRRHRAGRRSRRGRAGLRARPARPPCPSSSTSASAARWDDLRAARAATRACRCSRRASSRRGRPAHRCARPARTPSCCCCATSTTRAPPS